MNPLRHPNAAMKSTEPLFMGQNPFTSSSTLGKTHYHPSRTQSLSKTEKKTALSPVRLEQPYSSHLTTQNLESQKLHETQKSCSGVKDQQPVFTELWPASSDCESSPTSSKASHNMESVAHKVKSGKNTFFTERGNCQGSDLTKHTGHFRDSPPQGQEEQRDYSIDEQQLSFWPSSPSPVPPSSTPTKTSDMDDYRSPFFSPAEGCLRDKCLSPCRDLPSGITLPKRQESQTLNLAKWDEILSEGEADDTELLHLQERANRLLLREECMYVSGGSIHAISEDLGCTDFSSSASVDVLQERPFIPGIKMCEDKLKARSDSEPVVSSQKSFVPPSLVNPQRPEEDILFQWRLRRKMEQAREGPWHMQHTRLYSPAISWQTQTLNHLPANGPFFKHQQSTQTEYSCNSTHPNLAASQSGPHASCFQASGTPPVPAFVASGSLVSQPQPVAFVPSHMHFTCDGLPGPIQSSHTSRQQMVSQDINMSHLKTKDAENNLPNEPVCESTPFLQPASSEAKEGGGNSHNQRPERKKKEKVRKKDFGRVITTRNQSKSSVDREDSLNVSSSHERVTQQPEHRQQKVRRDVSYEATAPSSPIHRAMGQVISETLFPPADSSSAQRAPVFPGSPVCPSSATPQPSHPPCEAHSSAEVIAQLLQEAEDSDEKEFEDDPLLQVLRKQRTWIRQQICQVDSVFNELLDMQVLLH